MKKSPPVDCLFVDIGGVLLSNGWDHLARRRVVIRFGLNWAQIQERHAMAFEIHEEGKLTFDEYLNLVIFFEKRPFTRAQFRRFMCDLSKPFPAMIELIRQLRARHDLKVVVVSNESRELNAYRIRKFGLAAFVDTFVSSCYTGLRKPDVNIFRLALDLSQSDPARVVYIENTPMFVEIAERLGIRGILHTDYKTTSSRLADMGLTTE
jgi:putative hydrolase of the HAD superfamily